jgi:hypothetical protein
MAQNFLLQCHLLNFNIGVNRHKNSWSDASRLETGTGHDGALHIFI